MRLMSENILIGSLWCSSVKPLGNKMLECLINDFRSLYLGVELDVKNLGLTIIRGNILNGTADTLARA